MGSNPSSVAFTPNGIYAFVTNYGDGTVDEITTADVCDDCSPVTSTILIGEYAGPYSVAITPDGTLAYVANQNAGSVSVITIADIGCDDECNPVTTTITGVGSTLNQIAITPNGREAYLCGGRKQQRSGGHLHGHQHNFTEHNSWVGTLWRGHRSGAVVFHRRCYGLPDRALLGAAAQTITFEFDDNAHSIAYTFPAGWCDSIPCTITAGYTDTPNSVWRDGIVELPGNNDCVDPSVEWRRRGVHGDLCGQYEHGLLEPTRLHGNATLAIVRFRAEFLQFGTGAWGRRKLPPGRTFLGCVAIVRIRARLCLDIRSLLSPGGLLFLA